MKVILSVFSVMLCLSGFGQMDTLFVEDLRSGWLSFDKKGNTIPYEANKSEIIFFEVPANADPDTYLLISCEDKFDIWIDDQLMYESWRGSKSFSVDSLLAAYISPPSITLYADEWKSYQLQTSLYKISSNQNKNRYRRISEQGFLSTNAFLICLILLVGMAGAYKRYFVASFSKTYQSPLSFKLRGLSAEDAYLGFGSLDNIFSIVYFGLISALVIAYLGYRPVQGLSSGSPLVAFGSVMLLGVLIIVYVVGKYLLSLIVAGIFDFKAIPNIQTQDYTHFYILAMSVCLGLALVDFSFYNFTSETVKWVTVFALITFMGFFQVWLLLKLDKFYSHRKLMIIAYLCTTEFLPGFLIVYWLVKS